MDDPGANNQPASQPVDDGENQAPQPESSPPDPFARDPEPAQPLPVQTVPPVQQPQVVVSSHGGGGKRLLKLLVVLVVIAALAAAGWYAYGKLGGGSKTVKVPASSKDIPLIKIGFLQADYGKLYPDMSVNDYSISPNEQMFEGLVRYEDRSKIAPDLATDWSNPNDKTWVFTVKGGVKFHDGHVMSANDVKYSIDKVVASKSDLAQTFASTIASVDVTGKDQVKITTTDPDPTLLNKLTFLYVIDANAPKGSEPSQAGTGPYRIKAGTTPSDKSVQMVAFDGYHGGRPHVRALDYGSAKSSAELVKAFQDHKYDIVGYAPEDKSKAVAATRFMTSTSDVDFIGFNVVKPGPLQNKLVREAIRYAVDPIAIGKARGSDVDPLSQMIPESVPGYNPAITPYKRNIEKAKQLLAQAGYPNGLTLRFSTSADSQASTKEISAELKQVGITLTLDEHKDFDEFINYFSAGKAEMFTVDYSSDTLDGLDIYTTTLQTPNYDNPKLTALLDQASTTVDPAKRLKLLQQAAVIIDQDIPVVPLSTESDLWLMDRNYVIRQDLPSSYLPVYFYKVHLR